MDREMVASILYKFLFTKHNISKGYYQPIGPRPKHCSPLNISAQAGLTTKIDMNSVWLLNS